MKISIEIDRWAVARIVLGAVLAWAGLGKIADPQAFYAALAAYQLPLPGAVVAAVAAVLPWLELGCGLLMLGGLHRRAAFGWGIVLSGAFALCTGQAWVRGLAIGCGCLDLRAIGIAPGSPAAGWLESPAFAFCRALVLGGLAVVLFRREITPTSSA